MGSIKSRISAFFSSIGALFIGCCGGGGACLGACVGTGCCGSFALFGLIGISSSTLIFLEELKPIFLALTIFSLSYAFYKAYKPKTSNCCSDENGNSNSNCCEDEKKSTFMQSKSFLWATTILCVIMWTYPYVSKTEDKQDCCTSVQEQVIEGVEPESCCPENSSESGGKDDCATDCNSECTSDCVK